MRRILFSFIISIIASISGIADAFAGDARLQASLITCYPGPEVYELCGHEAIRIRGIDADGIPVDSVWNYGVFDFASPNFIYRFCKGETDYMVMGYPFAWFLPQYVERGSKVVEQDLNLSPEQTLTLRRLLQVNSLPANRTYRYNYVRDNCSTRVANLIDSAVAPATIIYPDSVSYASFRDAMRHFHRNYPWYQLGIDLALGAGIDMPITAREEMFAPVLLEEKVEQARFADGTPLVKYQTVLNEGGDATLPPTPFWLSPLFFSLLILAFSIAVAVREWKKSRIVRWWMTAFFSLLGILGCVVWFLVFISSHDSTSPNLLFLWLNPLQLVLAICIWWRHTRPAAMAMAICNIIILIVLIGAWPLQPQSANTAVFPLWGATLILSAVYAIIYPKDSLYIEERSEKLPVRRRSAGTPSTPRRRPSRNRKLK